MSGDKCNHDAHNHTNEEKPTSDIDEKKRTSQIARALHKMQESAWIRKEARKDGLVKSQASTETVVGMFSDKKFLQQRNAHMQTVLERLEHTSNLDLSDSDTSLMVIFLLQKTIKNQREISFLGKFLRQLSVFQARQELLTTSSMSNTIIQNLRCVFIRKHGRLFNYGDRGEEYFILLQGKAYCLIPSLNMMPYEEVAGQTRESRTIVNVIEDEADEEFLVKNYPRSQCVKIYQPGQSFGEIALLTSENKRMASIICKEDSYFMSLDREGFNTILGSYAQHLLNQKVHFLKRFALFKQIPENKICSFLHESREKQFQLNQPIYNAGDKSTQIYFIISGEVELIADLNKSSSTSSSSSSPNQSSLVDSNYSSFFSPNSRITRCRKSLVRLTANTYFGDEDLTVASQQSANGILHSYSAVSVSEGTRILELDTRTLMQFLKVYEMFTLLKKTAAEKAVHYASIIAQDNRYELPILLQDDLTPSIPSTQKSSDKSLPLISKFKNVFNTVSNANLRSKNYLVLNNVHNSTCTFSISDVPMTTTMNQDRESMRRLQYRFSKKNLSTSSIGNTSSSTSSAATNTADGGIPTQTFNSINTGQILRSRLPSPTNSNSPSFQQFLHKSTYSKASGNSSPPSMDLLLNTELTTQTATLQRSQSRFIMSPKIPNTTGITFNYKNLSNSACSSPLGKNQSIEDFQSPLIEMLNKRQLVLPISQDRSDSEQQEQQQQPQLWIYEQNKKYTRKRPNISSLSMTPSMFSSMFSPQQLFSTRSKAASINNTSSNINTTNNVTNNGSPNASFITQSRTTSINANDYQESILRRKQQLTELDGPLKKLLGKSDESNQSRLGSFFMPRRLPVL